MTANIRIGTGFNSMTSHNLMVTGVMRRIVVTLSKKDDKIAVKRHKQIINGQTRPFVI